MAGEIPIPDAVVPELDLHVSDLGRWIVIDHSRPPRHVPVPVDFYLREVAELDIDDDSAIAAFLDTWGLPVHLTRNTLEPGIQTVKLARSYGWLPEGSEMNDAREDVAISLGLLPPREGDLAGGLRRMGKLIDAGIDSREILTDVVNWGEAFAALDDLKFFASLADASGEDVNVGDYVERLNSALTIFAPRVSVGDDPAPTVVNIAAAQMANDIHSSAMIQKCQNETCKRSFTKQRGRSTKGTHRSKGVLYCSHSCARAQAQREFRRQRRRREIAADGTPVAQRIDGSNDRSTVTIETVEHG